jgi:signal transduction histidine kinase
MVGAEAEQLIGIKLRDFIPTEKQEAFDETLQKTGQSGTRAEFNLQLSSGQYVPVQLSMYQLAADDTSGISVIVTDITERVQSEEKIRSLASELTRAEQEERQRISQMLHDDLQQRLFAIKTQLSFLKDLDWKEQGLPESHVDLDQIQQLLSEAINVTRNLSIDLSPIVLHSEGLNEAMTWLAFRMQEQYGLHVELEVKENFAQLNNQMRMLLFYSVRELLFNIVKHADTLEAKVILEQVDGMGCITVRDQGKGFDLEAVMNHGKDAHGLLIIRDRLDLLGCRMQASAKPGEGTQVRIEIPKERMAL